MEGKIAYVVQQRNTDLTARLGGRLNFGTVREKTSRPFGVGTDHSPAVAVQCRNELSATSCIALRKAVHEEDEGAQSAVT